MKRISLVTVFCLALVCSSSAMEAFDIDTYHIDMEVMENNVYHITETIDLTFTEERRGIIRELPLLFDKKPVNIHSVSVPGHQYKIMHEPRTLLIRIGHPDILVHGRQRYVIRYAYDVGADSLSDMDEFNHNLIGLEWDTTIAAASFDIRLPKPFRAEDVNVTSGPYGSTDNTGVDWTVHGTTIRGSITRPLGNHEGLTVALPLPEGYWVGAKRHWPPLKDLLLSYPLYGLMIFFAWLLWFTKGRDKPVIPVVEFRPPDGLNPAEIGYIVDGLVDTEDITALVIHWAQKGCLTIEEIPASTQRKGGYLVLTKVRDLDAGARSYEKKMFRKMFELGTDGKVTTRDLSLRFYSTIAETQNAVMTSFSNHPERALYDPKSQTVKLGGLSFSSGFVAGIFAFVPLFLIAIDLFKAFDFNLWLSAFMAFFAVIVVIGPFATLGKHLSLKGAAKKKELLIAFAFGSICAAALGFAAVYFASVPVPQYLAALCATVLSSFFIHLMPKRTPYGDSILSRVLGFREFIEKAEKAKLELMFEADPQYYYHILPYAIVLRSSSKWSAHFEGMAVPPPTWYGASRRDRFDIRDFEKRLNNDIAALTSSMNEAPASSSSSGSSGSSSSGGFSGGGSGGGGGRSW
ncbi:hypothetical protein JCM14469_22840 [Desulfatiferula olefinivorans]